MAKLNIYKIEDEKIDEFTNKAADRLNFIATKEIIDDDGRIFGMSLYMIQPQDQREISWNWLLMEFEKEKIVTDSNPRGIIEIKLDETLYVATFGSAYFLVDKYCDRKFPFEFAKRSDYKDIKTTALISPSRQRNKTINTYIKCKELEYDSGESFSKIKANIKIEEDEKRFNGSIEIGNSVRFSMKINNLKNITSIIDYIDETMQKEPIHNIPLFNKINGERASKLDKKLIQAIKNEEVEIEIAEMDVIGVNEIFHHNDSTYTIEFGKIKEEITDLNYDIVMDFVNRNCIDIEEILNIEVVSYQDDNFSGKNTVKELIEYIDDKEKAVLSNGIWYEYNEDYLKYLADSLEGLPVIYNENYNYSKTIHEEYIGNIIKKMNETNKDVNENDVRKKYYKEYVFNKIMEEKYGFKNYDRKIEDNVESMDLYKDKTMFAVKIGNSSSKLCYVIDQSITALKMYKNNMFTDAPEVENVAIWLILNRKTHLKEKNGKININELDMLMLKNRIDSWMKNVRVLGYKPVIYINYYNQD